MKVSVCLASYNGENYILEQLTSILSQLNINDEVVISDDGSTDKTLSIINNINDARIKLVHSKKGKLIKNFENALKNASGNVIFLSDQDDIWFPNKVETCLKYLKEYDLVFSNLVVFTKTMEETRLLYDIGKPQTGVLRNIIKNNYIGATMAFKRNVLTQALPFPDSIYMHDVWLALIAEIKGSTFFIKEPLIYYRRHGANASQTSEKSTNSFYKKMMMRILLIYNLMKRI